MVIERLPMLGPFVQKEAIEVLLGRGSWTDAFLAAVEQGKVTINPSRLKLLKTSVQAPRRSRIEAILASFDTGKRAEVLQQYRPALSRDGNAERGRTVFRKSCAACHQVEQHGHPIGPNLATITNRGKEQVLVHLLDPNREVNPEYLNYVLVTIDGRPHTGMIAAQSATSITLKRGENRVETILRRDIDTLTSSGLSLMPEGLEKSITIEQMADFLKYLETIR